MRTTLRRALLPALLLALPLLAPLPVASSASHAADTLVAPLPRHGDEALYHFGLQQDGEPEYRVWIRWNGTERTHDGWGNAITVDIVHVTSTTGSGGYRYAYPGGAIEPAYLESGSHPRGEAVYREYPPVPAYLMDELCLARAGWQGATLADLDGAPMGRLCPSSRFAEGSLEYDREERVQGVSAHRFRIVTERDVLGSIWLAPGIPFPVGLTTCDTCRVRELSRYGAALVSYQRGEGPDLLAPASAPASRRPATEIQPYGPHGPANDGAANFTLADAVAAFERDPGLTQWREWRASRPDARIWHADYTSRTSPPDLLAYETWHVGWTANDGTAWELSAATQPGCGLAPRLPQAPMPSPCPATVEGGSVDCGDCHHAVAPSRSLTLGAAVRRFQEEREGEPQAKIMSVGFSLATPRRQANGYVTTLHVVAVPPADESAIPLVAEYDATTGAMVSEIRPAWSLPSSAAPSTTQGNVLAAPAPSGVQAPGVPLPVPTPDRSYVAAGGAVVLALVLARLLRLPALAVVLYSRISDAEVGTHPRRAAVLDAIRAAPGATLEDLERKVGFGGGALRHHVEVLARAKKITRVKAGGATRHFMPSVAGWRSLQEEALLMADTAEARALRLVRACPGIHGAEVARELGVTPAAVHFVVKELSKKGLVREERAGRKVLLYPRDPKDLRA